MVLSEYFVGVIIPRVEFTQITRKSKHKNRTKIRHPIFVVICLIYLTILNLSSGIPLPQAPVSPVTPPTATAASNSNSATTKKISTRGVFNSWLCGAGYIYDRATKMCNAQVTLSKNISATHLTGSANPAARALSGGQTANLGNQTNPLTDQAASAETAEDVQAAKENISSFFPLECGINYRYLKAAKMCKPKTAPASSESDENKKGKSSSEE